MATALAVIATLPTIDMLMKEMSAKTAETIKDKQGLIHCELAHSFGKLPEYLNEMDDAMKTWIGVTIELLNKRLHEDEHLPWDTVIECLMGNPVLQPDGEGITKNETLEFNSKTSWWKTDGTPHPGDPKCVKTEAFIHNLINDDDIMHDLSFKPENYGLIVADTGAAVKDFGSLFYGDHSAKRSVIDVGVLRYPDMDHPYFKAYRVQLQAWCHCKRIMFVETNKSGIEGSFNSRRFQPRESVVQGIKDSAKEKAIDLVNHLFD